MTTDDRTAKAPTRKTAGEWAELVRKWWWLVVVVITMASWQADHPSVRNFFSALSGVDALDQKVDQLIDLQTQSARDNARNFTELGQKVQSNTRRIDDIRSDRKIVDWDIANSYVKRGCRVGGECVAVFRLNRTPFGEACGRPFDLVGTVVNTNGQPHHQRLDDSKAIRATTAKGNVEVTFTAPSLARPGPARFYVSFRYPGCLPDRPEIELARSSDEIKFELLPER